MQWKLPPKIKVLEALGAVGDGRVECVGNTAKVTSSSGNKKYRVEYDPLTCAITANDNGSYWQGYLGYPAIAFLLEKGIIPYDPRAALALAGIPWKDLNTKFKNNFELTEKHVQDLAAARGVSAADLYGEIDRVMGRLGLLKLEKMKTKEKPPQGY